MPSPSVRLRWRLIRRHTMRERLNAKLRQVKATLRRMRHLPIPEQGRYLRLVLNGFYNYYTPFRPTPVPSNAFYHHVLCHWLRCLRRRGQRRRLTWRRMMRIAERWLPSPKLRHPYPDWRFDVMTRGRSPGAVVPLAGICAGAASNHRPYRDLRDFKT
jgi:hypothetical protein